MFFRKKHTGTFALVILSRVLHGVFSALREASTIHSQGPSMLKYTCFLWGINFFPRDALSSKVLT